MYYNTTFTFRKKKTRQEFIVTLDGFKDKKRKERNNRSRKSPDSLSPPKRERTRSSSFTQSDEEFERILQQKEREEKEERDKREKRTQEERSHQRRHQHHRSNRRNTHARNSKGSPPMNNLDREILLAEQKLRAQKLLKKSLDQVQSLDTESFALNPLLKKPKTAFVNPHFKPKVDLPVMNVVPLNVAGQPLVVNQSVPTAPTFLSAAPPLVLQRPLQPKVILPMSPVNISPIAITKPVQLIQQLVHEKPQVKGEN